MKKKKPIFLRILIPVMILAAVEIMILISTIFGQGIIGELVQNEKDIVDEHVRHRKDFLENRMNYDWMNLDHTVDQINSITRDLLDSGSISLDTLDESSAKSSPLLMAAAEELIDALRLCRSSGVFLVLNTGDPEKMEDGDGDKPGIYLRDADPQAPASSMNQDLLVERGPVSVVQELGIAADSSWRVKIETDEKTGEWYEFLDRPYRAAFAEGDLYSWSDLGYWSSPYRLSGEGKWLISYSVPLILDDGTVYGVVGIDISYDYMGMLLPEDEISSSSLGAYFLARETDSSGVYSGVFGNNNNLNITEGSSLSLGEEYYYHAEPLNIYNSNTPFAGEQWVLVGAVPGGELKSFSTHVNHSMTIAVYVALILGLAGSFLSSYILQRPLARVSRQMRAQDPRSAFALDPTGIREIDQMTEAIEKLSRDVIESGSKFTKIIEMASVRLAGFQVDTQKGQLFLTDYFFHIFLLNDLSGQKTDMEGFKALMYSLSRYIVQQDDNAGSYLYKIPDRTAFRYVHLRIRKDQSSCYGLAEDVTQTILEKEMLKQERDHDLLTGLFNRRAFKSRLGELFEQKDQLRRGAFLMFDLDNLKFINDTYGHDYGDQYIRSAAHVFRDFLPEQSVYARISGDEFNVFIYGFGTREELEHHIRHLQEGISGLSLELPGGKTHRIGMSGGIAWYPENGTSCEELMKYADFAMYCAKKNSKGGIEEFDLELFRSQNVLMRNKGLLSQMIEREAVRYVFQPIVDASTGEVYAYEALMRPAMPEFRHVGEILDAAQAEGKLRAFEKLTWFVSMRTFVKHIQEGRIPEGCCLFVNSIPNQRMGAEEEAEFAEKYQSYMSRVVMELTEEEQFEQRSWDGKQSIMRCMGGRIALDDYGTGYNSEKMLLTISPEFIKVDMAIVKDIHLSSDKRSIVSYITQFAHERGKYIIAEGVETWEETRTVIDLGVDYLQGYFLARPQEVPEGIPEKKKMLIREYAKKKK